MLRDYQNTIVSFLIAILVVVAATIVLGYLNAWANDRQQAKCEANGGEFFRAPLAQNSLCRLFTNK